MKDNRTLGIFLRDARLDQGLSQQSIADELGYTSAQFISNWERDVAAPPLPVLMKLARRLKVSESELFEKVLESSKIRMESNMRGEFKKLRSAK